MKKEEILAHFNFERFFRDQLGALVGSGERRTGRCVFHDDSSPSFAVNIENGTWKCHAGCGTGDVFTFIARQQGLDVRRDFKRVLAVAASIAGMPGEGDAIFRAVDVPDVREWLRSERGLPDEEIERIRGSNTNQGPAVAFEYQSDDGVVLYWKLRPIVGPKKFWRLPRGSKSVLYGLPDLLAATSGSAIVVEGELDAHALRACGFAPVVSVPDGVGSKLTPDLLAPLSKFEEVLIAVDNDPAGESFARKLADALGLQRCRRVKWSAGGAR